jgi:hypothetical protein
MKRWAILLERIGTTVIAIGLALFLVSLIPPTAINGLSYNWGVVYSNGFSTGPGPNIGYPSNAWGTVYWGVLTEPQTLHVNIAANASLNVYILEVSSSTIDDWINQTYSGSVDFSNVTYLDQFLDSHPSVIGWQGEINNGTIAFEYTPRRIVNISLIVSDHSLEPVGISAYELLWFSSVAPVSKVQTLSEFAVPIGVAFTLPYLGNLLKAKKKRGEPERNE